MIFFFKEKTRVQLDKKIPVFFKYFEKLRMENSSSKFLVGDSVSKSQTFISQAIFLYLYKIFKTGLMRFYQD